MSLFLSPDPHPLSLSHEIGVRQQDLNRTNSNPTSCFLLLTEGLTFAMFSPSSSGASSDNQPAYSDAALNKWYDAMAKAVGAHQIGKI